MMVRLEGRKCLVVGGGKIAAGKIAGLLKHGAQVTVVSPRAVRRIQELAKNRQITWRRREFSPRDVNRAFLAIAATNSISVNETVFRACEARDVLCNAVDDPERCDFYYPAVVRRGPLQIAISTNGQSPALAARLRRQLEQQFGPEWSGWVEEVGRRRREVMSREGASSSRRKALLKMASPAAFREFTGAGAKTLSKQRRRRRRAIRGSR